MIRAIFSTYLAVGLVAVLLRLIEDQRGERLRAHLAEMRGMSPGAPTWLLAVGVVAFGSLTWPAWVRAWVR